MRVRGKGRYSCTGAIAVRRPCTLKRIGRIMAAARSTKGAAAVRKSLAKRVSPMAALGNVPSSCAITRRHRAVLSVIGGQDVARLALSLTQVTSERSGRRRSSRVMARATNWSELVGHGHGYEVTAVVVTAASLALTGKRGEASLRPVALSGAGLTRKMHLACYKLYRVRSFVVAAVFHVAVAAATNCVGSLPLKLCRKTGVRQAIETPVSATHPESRLGGPISAIYGGTAIRPIKDGEVTASRNR